MPKTPEEFYARAKDALRMPPVEHLHWWFMARPARMRQLSDSSAAIWDEVLPPVPEEISRENAGIVAAALRT